MKSLGRILPLAAVVAGAAALPAAADAAVEHAYIATIDVTTQYEHNEFESTNVPVMSESRSSKASTHLKGDIGGIVFREGRLMWPAGDTPIDARSTGESEAHYRSDWWNADSACTADPSDPDHSARPILDSSMETPLDGSELLGLRVADSYGINWDCTFTGRPLGDGGGHVLVEGDPPIGKGPMDVEFKLPREAIGMGKIIQVIEGPPAAAGDFCPGLNEHSTTCSFSWKGTITFTKVETREVEVFTGQQPADGGDDLIAPLVPAKPPVPQPAPPKPPNPPIDEGDDLIAPLVPAKGAKVNAKGTTVSFTAGCAGGCSGTAVVTAGGATARAAASRKPLATVRFAVKAGPARRVTLRLPRAAARKVKRAGRATIAVTLTPKGGKATRTTLRVTVPRR